jgi:hypothetical protein
MAPRFDCGLCSTLLYPRYKVASVSFAASDVELHCLHSDMHFGPRQSHQDCFRRGSWLRQVQDAPLFSQMELPS